MKASLLTISQWPRREFLKCQVDHIKAMLPSAASLVDKVEWVIVNASKVEESAFTAWCKEHLVVDGVEIRIVEPECESHDRTIGRMRQLGNDRCQGDIIVCVDDDDYYFPTRLSHAVRALQGKKEQIAACTRSLILDDDLGVVLQLSGIHARHGVHSTMAYTKKYARTHSYDVSKTFAEEASFTHGFTEPMVQLQGSDVFMQISHASNTFCKTKILLTAMIGNPEIGTVVGGETPETFLSKHSPRLLELVRDQPLPVARKITFYCGVFGIEWDPKSTSLGGSEQAVIYLARCFQARGYPVRVYGNFGFQQRVMDGVEYHHAHAFRCRAEYDVLILWRLYGMAVLASPNVSARALVVDLHDNIPQSYAMIENHAKKIHRVFCKSEFHQKILEMSTHAGKIPGVVVVPNGVRVDTFQRCAAPEKVRNHKHLVYASSYKRGLLPLLKHAWPILVHLETEAVLHVCYGMEDVSPQEEEFRQEMTVLLQQRGIVHHGRLGVEQVARLKSRCGFHLYYTATTAEIDCISIRESLVVGCIPVLSEVNVFGQRHGIHVKGLGFEKKGYVELARQLYQLLSAPQDTMDEVRRKLQESDTVMDWDTVAGRWLKALGV